MASECVINPASREDAEIAKASSQALLPFAHGRLTLKIALPTGVREVELPAPAVGALVAILTEMAAGNAVTLLPIHAQLTTQMAADILNVSRPHICKLLDSGAIKHQKVGTHRRIAFSDLMDYKQKSDEDRQRALTDLAADAQENGLGYK